MTSNGFLIQAPEANFKTSFYTTSSSFSFAFKAATQISTLFLFNWMLWQPFHSAHHLGPKLIETSQLEEKEHEHLHTYSSVHSHSETSSPADKNHQQQAEDECWFLYCNSSTEHVYIPKQISLLKRQNINYYNIKYTEFELLNNIYLINEHSPRGPPSF